MKVGKGTKRLLLRLTGDRYYKMLGDFNNAEKDADVIEKAEEILRRYLLGRYQNGLSNYEIYVYPHDRSKKTGRIIRTLTLKRKIYA